MPFDRQSPITRIAAVFLAAGFAVAGRPARGADEAAPVRSQAVVNLSFDEAAGDALDTAGAGAVKDIGTLQNGAQRVRNHCVARPPCPPWGCAPSRSHITRIR